MAISFETLLPEILPMVPGCPDTLIENNIRSAVIELCERAGVYQAELDPVTTVSNIYEYDLEAPTGTSVRKVLWVTHLGKDLNQLPRPCLNSGCQSGAKSLESLSTLSNTTLQHSFLRRYLQTQP